MAVRVGKPPERTPCGRLPEWDDMRIETLPQAGRKEMNPAEGVRVG